MRRKNNNFIILLLVLIIILLVGIIFLLVNDNTKNDELKNDTNKNNVVLTAKLNDYLKDTTSFSLKDGLSLIALDNKGKETLIYDFLNHSRDIEDIRYFYDSSSATIYLSIKSYEKGNHKDENLKFEIASIDLSKNREFYVVHVLTEVKVDRNYFDKMNADSLVKVGNYIYFANSKLYKMRLDDYSIESMNVSSASRQIEILRYTDNIIIYNTDKNIYKYDVITNKREKIVENALIEYIYGNEFIYNDVSNNVTGIYKSYNLDTKEIKQISDNVGRALLGFSYAVPYKNSYISLRGNIFYYDDDKMFELNCDVVDIDACEPVFIDSYIIYRDHILVSGYVNADEVPIGKAFKIVVDLEKGIIKSVTETDDCVQYRYVTYIK